MNGFIGEVRMFGGNFAPRNWAFCEGQLLAISQNTALFSILGTTYGGDGRTTFALPDLRGRVAIHAGTGPGLSTRRLGQRSGTSQNHMNTLTMPNHSHTATIGGTITPLANAGTPNDTDDPANAYYQVQESDVYADAPTTGEKAGALASSLAFTLGMTGASQAINNMQPYNVTNYVICMLGTFPSRS